MEIDSIVTEQRVAEEGSHERTVCVNANGLIWVIWPPLLISGGRFLLHGDLICMECMGTEGRKLTAHRRHGSGASLMGFWGGKEARKRGSGARKKEGQRSWRCGRWLLLFFRCV